MSRRIVLVTKIGRNYGALLQAYALKKTLERMDSEVSILNYALPGTMTTYRVLPKVQNRSSLKQFLKELPQYFENRRAVEKSLKFREQYFNFTKEYCSFEELEKDPPDAEIYITGSDQVWNPLINFDKAYYLLFGRKDAVRASYAASIGVKELPAEYVEEFLTRIGNVTYRSVREIEGQKLLEGYGIQSDVHIDPTLLLRPVDYEEILIEPQIAEPYILLYLLILPENPQAYVKRIRELYPGYKIVSISGTARKGKLGDIQLVDVGPGEFIGLIKNAEAIVTSSFHGTVFSILFERKFATFLPPKTGGRMKNLLGILGLSNHIIASEKELTVGCLDAASVYPEVQNILNQKREEADKYLRGVLEE